VQHIKKKEREEKRRVHPKCFNFKFQICSDDEMAKDVQQQQWVGLGINELFYPLCHHQVHLLNEIAADRAGKKRREEKRHLVPWQLCAVKLR
jgi:hypothetical protein